MKLQIDILPNYYLREDETYNKEGAINLSGKIAGVCYDKEGLHHLMNEPENKTTRRIDMTLNNGHHSVYDHAMIGLNIQNIPKILAMVINNEKQYTTSEKSARYTPVVRGEDSVITMEEEMLYNKWIEIFKVKIKDMYGHIYNDAKIQKLAQENARYLVTVFMPTTMVYTTSLRQLNYLASWMNKYINSPLKTNFEKKLADAMKEFVSELDRLNILEDGLLRNEKDRSLSLFGEDLDKTEEVFSNVYSTTYKSSFAMLAQAQRHRTIDYQMEILDEKEYYIPPILLDDAALVEEWINDMKTVKDVTPQGELVLISEMGTFDNFILKCKERLCSAAQLEIMEQTRDTLLRYKEELERKEHPLSEKVKQYSLGARCTFKDFKCTSNCKFKEGIDLSRKI